LVARRAAEGVSRQVAQDAWIDGSIPSPQPLSRRERGERCARPRALRARARAHGRAVPLYPRERGPGVRGEKRLFSRRRTEPPRNTRCDMHRERTDGEWPGPTTIEAPRFSGAPDRASRPTRPRRRQESRKSCGLLLLAAPGAAGQAESEGAGVPGADAGDGRRVVALSAKRPAGGNPWVWQRSGGRQQAPGGKAEHARPRGTSMRRCITSRGGGSPAIRALRSGRVRARP